MSWPKPLKPNRVAFWKAAIDLNRGCLSVSIWCTYELMVISRAYYLKSNNETIDYLFWKIIDSTKLYKYIGTHVMLNSISNDNDLWVCVMKHLSSKNFYRFLHTKRNYSYKCVSYLFKKNKVSLSNFLFVCCIFII